MWWASIRSFLNWLKVWNEKITFVCDWFTKLILQTIALSGLYTIYLLRELHSCFKWIFFKALAIVASKLLNEKIFTFICYFVVIVCLMSLLLLELVMNRTFFNLLKCLPSRICYHKKLFLFDLTHFSRMNWKDQKDQSSLFNRFFIFYLNSFFKRNVFKKQNFERKLKFKALHLIWFTNNSKELLELEAICCLNLI